jgi:hypothetical protein
MNKLNMSDLSVLWDKSLPDEQSSYKDIDLSHFRFINPDALIGLCALIEDRQSRQGTKYRVILPKIRMEGEGKYRIISNCIDKNDELLGKELLNAGVYFDPADLADSRSIVRFISFLHNIGFTQLWDNSLEYINFPRDQLNDLVIFRGSRKTRHLPSSDDTFRRYTTIHRLAGSSDNRNKMLLSIIDQLLDNAPASHRRSPLFEDNELKEVFLTQLAENIASHAHTAGYVMARTFSADELQKKKNPENLIPSCSIQMQKECLERGFFEIIIADNGPGICSTLKTAYRSVLKEVLHIPINNIENDIADCTNIIQYALDEFGSRYVKNDDRFKALIDRHSMNQVFQYTRKYGGSLHIISDGICIYFDTNEQIYRGKYGLGFQGKTQKGAWPQIGLNIKIILPHNPNTIQEYPKARTNRWPSTYPSEKIYPTFCHLGSELLPNPNETAIIQKASEITKTALYKKIDQLVLDFSGTAHWATDLFLIFLFKMENLISNIHCWGINVPDVHIQTLRSRWENRGVPVLVEEIIMTFPCLDKTSHLQLISKELLHLSAGLSLLFEGTTDDRGNYMGPDYYPVSDIFQHLKRVVGKTLSIKDEDELSNVLARNSHLFKNKDGTDQWTARIDSLKMLHSSNRLLVDQFERVLRDTKSIHRGINERTNKEKIYALPSSGKYVKEYIWTYNLLQIGTHTDEIARRLKNALDIYHGAVTNGSELGAIVCATAPARILAEAIAKLYEEPPPVFDLGGIDELDPDEVLSSFKQDKVKTCIIVTDVLDTKRLILRIIQMVESYNAEVIAIAAIIRFVRSSANRWFASVVKEVIEAEDSPHTDSAGISKSYPIAILYDYPSPEILEKEDFSESHELYWIEPYSLRPFAMDTLIKPHFAWETEERSMRMPERICLLDNNRYIRYGHFKNKSHHNRILIHMQRALQDELLADYICDDIICFMGNKLPDVIIIPLHSSINYLIPHLNNRLREKSMYRPVICSIAVDLKGRGPWYILPNEAQEILKGVTAGRLMFLDDAILTGRTVETFLRAIDRFIIQQKVKQRRTPKGVKIDSISIYCIINRIGRAASTKLRKTEIFSGAKFFFREFVRFESPVYSPNDCPLCKDQHRLIEYRSARGSGVKRIDKWIDDEIEKLEPIATSTRKHREKISDQLQSTTRKGATHYDFLHIDGPQEKDDSCPQNGADILKLTSVDGTLWWFWELSYRGSPPIFLLQNFRNWLDSQDFVQERIKEYLLTEVLLWSLDNIASLNLDNDPQNLGDNEANSHVFYDLLLDLLKCGGVSMPRVLEKSGMILLDRHHHNDESLRILFKIFDIVLYSIRDLKSADAVASIILGYYLIIIRARISNMLPIFEKSLTDLIKKYIDNCQSWQGYLRNMLAFVECEASDNEFLYALNLLLKERFKERHSEIFRVRSNIASIESIASVKYLVDVVQRIERSLDIVIPISDSDESMLAREIRNLKDHFGKLTEILENNTTEIDKFQEYLEAIHYYLLGTSNIGMALERYNPSINEVLNRLRDTITPKLGEVEIASPTANEIRVLGDLPYLEDTLKNHIWSVLDKHSQASTCRIKVRIEEDGHSQKVKIFILNNWLTNDEAANLIKQGLSFTVEQREWARYGAELEYPEKADEAGYCSMLVIQFQKGLKREAIYVPNKHSSC